MARRVPHAITAVHHPLFALDAERVCVPPAYPDGIHVVGCDAGVIQVFGTVDARLLPPNVDVLLSGRVHR